MDAVSSSLQIFGIEELDEDMILGVTAATLQPWGTGRKVEDSRERERKKKDLVFKSIN